VQSLDRLVRDSLYEVFGMAVGRDAWKMRRCVRSDVVLLDSGCMNISDTLDAAHLRFAAKPLANRTDQDFSDGSVVDGDCAAAQPGLTTVLRARLGKTQPWRARVDAAAAELLPDTDIKDPLPAEDAVAADHTLLHASNSTISQAVHSRRKRRLVNPEQVSQHGNGRPAQRPDAARASAAVQANTGGRGSTTTPQRRDTATTPDCSRQSDGGCCSRILCISSECGGAFSCAQVWPLHSGGGLVVGNASKQG
jgi:hypothetical protein